MLRRVVGIAALAALASGEAVAADMPLKAPPRPAPVYSWTGFYIGGNVGAGWGEAKTDASTAGTASFPPALGVPDTDVAASRFSDSARLRGLIGGGQIGFNVQSGQFVFGIEADLQASGQKGRLHHDDPFIASGSVIIPPVFESTFAVTGTATTDSEARIEWFGTVRGRLGVASGPALLYATGGLAYGRVKVDGTVTTAGSVSGEICVFLDCVPVGPNPFGPDSASFSGAKVKYGWTAGGGFEWAATRELSFKVEYLYLDLGTLTVNTATTTGVPVTYQTRFTDHIARVGFNYRFTGLGATP
jgi:outer membrane immunogenic protein